MLLPVCASPDWWEDAVYLSAVNLVPTGHHEHNASHISSKHYWSFLYKNENKKTENTSVCKKKNVPLYSILAFDSNYF